MKSLTLLIASIILALPSIAAAQARGGQAPPAPAAAPCNPEGKEYVCGQQAPEDLVVVPGGEWVVAGSYGGNGGIKLINTRDRTTINAYPTATSKDRLDSKTYDSCPGAPDAAEKAKFTTHGLALRARTATATTICATTVAVTYSIITIGCQRSI